jgi:hypothetical protein
VLKIEEKPTNHLNHAKGVGGISEWVASPPSHNGLVWSTWNLEEVSDLRAVTHQPKPSTTIHPCNFCISSPTLYPFTSPSVFFRAALFLFFVFFVFCFFFFQYLEKKKTTNKLKNRNKPSNYN